MLISFLFLQTQIYRLFEAALVIVKSASLIPVSIYIVMYCPRCPRLSFLFALLFLPFLLPFHALLIDDADSLAILSHVVLAVLNGALVLGDASLQHFPFLRGHEVVQGAKDYRVVLDSCGLL